MRILLLVWVCWGVRMGMVMEAGEAMLGRRGIGSLCLLRRRCGMDRCCVRQHDVRGTRMTRAPCLHLSFLGRCRAGLVCK